MNLLLPCLPLHLSYRIVARLIELFHFHPILVDILDRARKPTTTMVRCRWYLRSIRTSVHRLQMAMAALRLAGASFCTKEAPWGQLNWAPQKLALFRHVYSRHWAAAEESQFLVTIFTDTERHQEQSSTEHWHTHTDTYTIKRKRDSLGHTLHLTVVNSFQFGTVAIWITIRLSICVVLHQQTLLRCVSLLPPPLLCSWLVTCC